ncbi:MAG: hypothetical protein OXC48_04915 [Endozoicomonadaceae bacterium]|nr:hypothetical protein [Endozoicomonadaceae bacterium]
MKKSLYSLYNTLLFAFSVALSILTVLFSCNGWGWPQNKNITYLITMDFNPNTNKFSNWHLKITRDDNGADISNLTTLGGRRTHLEIHNGDPLPADTYAIKLITIKDAIAVAKRRPNDFCASWCGVGNYVVLKRTDSRVPLTLKNQDNTSSIKFDGWLIYSSVGDENSTDRSGFAETNHQCKIYNQNIISNGYKQNCIVTPPDYVVIHDDGRFVSGSMQFVFDELKAELKKPENPDGIYEGSTLYEGDSITSNYQKNMIERYTFHFRVRKLATYRINSDKNNLTVNLKWHTVRQSGNLYTTYANGRALFSIDGFWGPPQALLLTIAKKTPLQCPYLPLDLKTIKEKVFGVTPDPQDSSCDLYMPYNIHLTALKSQQHYTWIDGQTLRIKPVQTHSFYGALDIDFAITTHLKPKYKSGSFSIPVTVNAELTHL